MAYNRWLSGGQSNADMNADSQNAVSPEETLGQAVAQYIDTSKEREEAEQAEAEEQRFINIMKKIMKYSGHLLVE